MKILFVNDFFVLAGGAEKVMLDIIKNMPNENEITIFTFFKDNNFEKIYDYDIKYIYEIVSAETNDDKLLEVIQSRGKAIIEKLNQEKFDIVVAMKEGYCTKFVSELDCENKFGWVHTNYRDNYWTGKVFNSKEEFKCLEKFKKIICVSKDVKNTIINRIGDTNNLCVRYNPVDNNKIVNLSKENIEFCTPSNTLNFITVGRIDPQKGFDRLINVANKLLDNNYKFNLYIIGDTDDLQYKNKLKDSVKYKDNIIFLGKKINPFPYIKKADCYISSSIWESFGVAIQEAIILHTPVIMTNCLGAIEIFRNNEYGIIVENSEEGIYKGMLSILDNPNILKEYKKYLKLDNYVTVEKRINEIIELFAL